MTTLRDFALVTFDVDPDVLARLLPDGYGFEPEVVTLADGRPRALVSAVNFRDIDFRFVSARWLRVSFVQTNYRAYVRRNGARAVWFFGTTLASRLAVLPRVAWSMPWHRVDATLEADWVDARCTRYESDSHGKWGSCELSLSGSDASAASTPLDGFANAHEAALVLTHPLVGYFGHGRRGVGRYEVWHAPLRPSLGSAIRARFSPFEERGLTVPGQAPHSVLLQRSTDFAVLLPPTRLPEP